ncbi:unnamed protein product [Gordionus sp. m RMFG-2023]|uniref:trans-1,2-dihydrobenzene-1,2-diol dehydrogenase-like n=1 Tax=Gordionus sp. m RMFG-2023 TaxID=3053472 RepID=UPI0030E39C66
MIWGIINTYHSLANDIANILKCISHKVLILKNLDDIVNQKFDIAYVGNVDNFKHDIVSKLIQQKKHILCEPPILWDSNQFLDILKLLNIEKRFFMEVIPSRFLPIYQRLRHQLKMKTIGNISFISANISFSNYKNIEKYFAYKKLLPVKKLDEAFIYPLHLIQMVYQQLPENVTLNSTVNSKNHMISKIMVYPNDKFAFTQLSSNLHLPNEAYICGTKGNIKICEPFWLPSKMIINDVVYDYPLDFQGTYTTYKNYVGFIYMAKEIEACIQAGLIESPWLTHQNSIDLASIYSMFINKIKI